MCWESHQNYFYFKTKKQGIHSEFVILSITFEVKYFIINTDVLFTKCL